jgi:hypothetical protein
LDYFYEPTSHFYEEEAPCNDEHCLMTPKGQRPAFDFDSPPRIVRRSSVDIAFIPSASPPIPEGLIFPDF